MTMTMMMKLWFWKERRERTKLKAPSWPDYKMMLKRMKKLTSWMEKPRKTREQRRRSSEEELLTMCLKSCLDYKLGQKELGLFTTFCEDWDSVDHKVFMTKHAHSSICFFFSIGKNRPFSSYLVLLFENEYSCKTFHLICMKMNL